MVRAVAIMMYRGKKNRPPDSGFRQAVKSGWSRLVVFYGLNQAFILLFDERDLIFGEFA